ncbi:hypothetical protein TNCV_1672681, partial [Trichonephila clavipes]
HPAVYGWDDAASCSRDSAPAWRCSITAKGAFSVPNYFGIRHGSININPFATYGKSTSGA